MRIGTKLAVTNLMMIYVTIVIISGICYFFAKNALEQQVLNRLESVTSNHKRSIESYISHTISQTNLITSRTQLRLSLEKYLQSSDEQHLSKMTRIINDAASSNDGIDSIYIFSLNNKLITSTNHSPPIFINKTHLYQSNTLASHQIEYSFVDNRHFKTSFVLIAPLVLNGEIIGKIAVSKPMLELTSIVNDYTGLGLTGETLLMMKEPNHETRLLNSLRHKQVFNPENSSLLLTSNITHQIGYDHRGIKVLYSVRYLNPIGWSLIVKMDYDEAFAIIYKIRNIIILCSIITGILVILLSLYFARRISKPIYDLTKAITELSATGSTKPLEATENDELGELLQSFNSMQSALSKAKQENSNLRDVSDN